MCFNISIISKHDILEQEMNAKFSSNIKFISQSHISAFSNPLIPIITSDNRSTIQLFYWGLIPHWVKTINKANELRKMTYNAKNETIKEKPSFKDSIKNRKCLILANGFYEWQTTSKGKICYYISSSDEKLFTFAGIWSNWHNTLNGKLIRSVSIITQQANEIMSTIHNIKKRQPVILHKHNYQSWLNSGMDFQDILDESFNFNFNYKIVNSPLKITT